MGGGEHAAQSGLPPSIRSLLKVVNILVPFFTVLSRKGESGGYSLGSVTLRHSPVSLSDGEKYP